MYEVTKTMMHVANAERQKVEHRSCQVRTVNLNSFRETYLSGLKSTFRILRSGMVLLLVSLLGRRREAVPVLYRRGNLRE